MRNKKRISPSIPNNLNIKWKQDNNRTRTVLKNREENNYTIKKKEETPIIIILPSLNAIKGQGIR